MGGRGARLRYPVPPFRTILSPEEQRHWGEQNYGDWQELLTERERQSLIWYTNDGSEEINTFLRDQAAGLPVDADPQNQQTMEYIDQIDRALRRSIAVEPIRVFRGLSNLESLYYSLVEGSLPPNGILTSPGYTSTSLQDKTAQSFMSMGGYRVMVEIDIPTGTHGAYLGHSDQAISATLLKHDEAEFLLPRGTRYRVKEYGPTGQSDSFGDVVYRLRVEVVEPSTPETGDARILYMH